MFWSISTQKSSPNLQNVIFRRCETKIWGKMSFWKENRYYEATLHCFEETIQNTQDNFTTSHLTDTKHNWVKRRRHEVVFSSNWSDLESFFFFGSIQRSKRIPPIRTRRKVDEIRLVLENTSRFWFLQMFQFMKLWILRNLDSSPTVVNTGQIKVIQPTQNVKSSMSISQDFPSNPLEIESKLFSGTIGFVFENWTNMSRVENRVFSCAKFCYHHGIFL